MRDDNLESEHEVPDVVLELFDAYVSSDDDTFIVLVNERFAALQAVSDTLARVPAAIRGDPEISEAWAQFAWAAAHLLAERGDRRLLDRITAPADNPMVRWQHAFELADHLREDGRFVESDELLTDLIAELRMCRGTGVDRVLGPALGTAGANAFDRGDLFAALDLTDEALRECERTADLAGIAIYSDNLATLVTATAGGRGAIRGNLARAQQLHDTGRLVEARDLVREVIAALDAAPKDGVERRYRAKAHGLLGMILYRMHDLSEAETETQRALEAGREANDDVAVVIYTANLEVLRGA